MPTKRRRHMITETAAVEAALEPLRDRGAKIDLGRLVVLGAAAEMAEIDNQKEEASERIARQREAVDRVRALVDAEYLLSDAAWR